MVAEAQSMQGAVEFVRAGCNPRVFDPKARTLDNCQNNRDLRNREAATVGWPGPMRTVFVKGRAAGCWVAYGARVRRAGVKVSARRGSVAGRMLDLFRTSAKASLHLERRIAPRKNTFIAARIVFGRTEMPCIIRNTSDTGAKLDVAKVGSVPDVFLLHAPGHRPQTCRVAWRALKEMGVE